MTILRQCRHYGYENGMACDQGVSLKRYSFHTAPCFPRNKETPCPERDWITQEEIDAEEAELLSRVDLASIIKARAAIIAEKKPQGSIECPKCASKLNYAVASYNGHVWARCEKADCLQWME